MEQSVAISCESCHGGVSSYAETRAGTTRDGEPAEFAVSQAEAEADLGIAQRQVLGNREVVDQPEVLIHHADSQFQ